MINFDCPHCETRIATSTDRRGKRVSCPECGRPVEVPNPYDPMVSFRCVECGEAISVHYQQLGRQTQCPGCRALVLAPTREEYEGRATPVSRSRCATCGLKPKEDIRCTACSARFCSTECLERHRHEKPHGCVYLLALGLLAAAGVAWASMA